MIDWIKKHPGIILIVVSVIVLTILSMTTFTFKHVELANNLELINTCLDRVCDNIAHIKVELKAFRAELQADVRGFQNDVGGIKENIKLREAFHQRHHADTIEMRQDMRRISDKVNESARCRFTCHRRRSSSWKYLAAQSGIDSTGCLPESLPNCLGHMLR